MKYLIIFIFSFLLFTCTNSKKVYWCGDHACINDKEKEAYFKKTMIVEIRELSKKNKKSKSEFEMIKKQAGLEQKKEIKNEKELVKIARLEEKKGIKKQKELAKLARLEEKRRVKEKKKSSKKKLLKTKNVPLDKEIIINNGISRINISSTEFDELIEKITKKNMFRPYPNINDIPN